MEGRLSRRGLRGVLALGCAAAIVLAAASPAAAGVINVETTSDVSVSDNECSLREALTTANLNLVAPANGCEDGGSGQDFIKLPAGAYTLLSTAGQEDANATGDLDYTGGGPVVIQGPLDLATGIPTATIDAPPNDRIIDVPPPNVPQRLLSLNLLTLTDGRALGVGAEGDGGAIRIADTDVVLDITTLRITGSRAARNGGAVSYDSGDVSGSLSVANSEFFGNSAGTQVAGGSGGAFWSGLALNDPIIKSSTLAGNTADGVGGGFALKSSDTPTIKFRNSTLSGNTSGAGGNAVGFFGTGGTSSAFFEFSTIAGNTSPFAHGALEPAGAGQAIYLRASIISGNTGAGVPSNCAGLGAFNSQGYNVESANTCALVPTAPNLVNTDPLLAPLAISTVVGAQQTSRTHGLYDGSPAVNFVPRTAPDKCDPQYTEDIDQRGIPRPAAQNGLCDAGAFEGTVGPKPVPPAGNPTPSPTPATPGKKCKKKKAKKRVGDSAKKKCKKAKK